MTAQRLETDSGARRTGNVRVGGRSARVVEDVLRAALEVLGEVGYEGLRIDDVAHRSGVNKTTIYRRWPTREALVRAALLALSEVPRPPVTGDVRVDLLAHLKAGVAWLTSPVGRGVARVIMRGDPEGELREMIAELRKALLGQRVALVEAAIARGELPAGTDARLVAMTIQTTIYSRLMRWEEDLGEAEVEAVVDLVLAGARAGGGVRTR